MANTEDIVEKVVILGSNHSPDDWKHYFLRNPTLVFEGMKVLIVVKLDENSDEPFTFMDREVRIVLFGWMQDGCKVSSNYILVI